MALDYTNIEWFIRQIILYYKIIQLQSKHKNRHCLNILFYKIVHSPNTHPSHTYHVTIHNKLNVNKKDI